MRHSVPSLLLLAANSVCIEALALPGAAEFNELVNTLAHPRRDDASDCTYDGCSPDNNTDVDDICGHAETDWYDRQIAANVWWETGSGNFLDYWIKSQYIDTGKPPTNWLQVMNDEWKTDETDNTIWSCATLGSEKDCELQASCEDYFDAEVHMYYINYASSKINAAFSYMQDKLQNWAIETGLDVPTLISDFGIEDDGINPFAILAAAFGIASGVVAPIGPVSAGFGIISSTLGISGQFLATSNDELEATLDENVKKYFQHTLDGLDDTLGTVFGSELGGDINDLPAQTEDYYNETPIGRFFADGKWLMFDVGDVIDPVFDQVTQYLTTGLIVKLLNQQGYFVWINTETEKADCHMESQTWLNDQCYSVVKGIEKDVCTFDPDAGVNSCSYKLERIAEDRWDKLIGQYGLDYTTFFNNAEACTKAHPDMMGTVDTSNFPYDGTIPLCFYKMLVTKGTWDSNDSDIQSEPL